MTRALFWVFVMIVSGLVWVYFVGRLLGELALR